VSLLGLYRYEQKKEKETLYIAIKNNDISTLNTLLSKNPNLVKKEGYFYTPLSLASYYSREKILEVLISYGADVNEKNDDGESPLFKAAQGNRIDNAKLLISRGADVNARNSNRRVPLHNARSKEMAQLLISMGADINARSIAGLTPLHDIFKWPIRSSKYISRFGFINQDAIKEKELLSLTQFLISKGADVNAKDITGETPFDRSAWARNNEMTKETAEQIKNLLCKSGAEK
jgi:ankyrin repeat protein